MKQVADTKKSRFVRSVLVDMEPEVFVESRPQMAGLVNWGGGANIPIHRWLRYREGYSPDLISELGLGQKILDPFCGCGSIMVGSAQLHRQSGC